LQSQGTDPKLSTLIRRDVQLLWNVIVGKSWARPAPYAKPADEATTMPKLCDIVVCLPDHPRLQFGGDRLRISRGKPHSDYAG
jgi:hypothetical protein